MYAIIDVGTNSIKLHIAKKDQTGQWLPVMDRTQITRLGEGMQTTGLLTPEAIDRNIAALTKMQDIFEPLNIKQTVVVGTMCLRIAKNAQEFIHRLQHACGFTLEVLSGEEEARLAYRGVTSGATIPQGEVLIFDTGGGSTEFIVGENSIMKERLSLNVGAVRYTEQFLVSDPVTQQEFHRAVAAIEQDLTGLYLNTNAEQLIGIGGGVTTLAAVKHHLAEYIPERIEGTPLNREELERQITLYLSKTLEERKHIVGLPPKRADVILAGAAIIRAILQKTEVNTITVSTRGIRHGVLIDRFA